MPSWKAWVGMLLLFAVGFLAGTVASYWYLHRDYMMRPERFLSVMEQHMIAYLQLTEEQQAVLEEAIRQAQQEFRAMIDRAKPEAEAIIRRAQDKLVPLLTEEQLRRLEEFRREGERIRRQWEAEEARRRAQ